MKVLFILAFYIAAGTAFPSEELYAEAPEVSIEDDSTKIIGGSLAKLGQFPYQAILYKKDSFVCGGSLISSDRVLTAAHCGKNNDIFTIRLGSVDLFSGGVEIPSCRFERHRSFNNDDALNDIAMIYLSKSVKFSSLIQPIALPEFCDDFAGESAVASGFGSTVIHEPPSFQLLYLNTQVISEEECKRTYSYIKESQICMSGSNGNVCSGDSGGPLAVGNTVVGIASYVHEDGCVNKPSVFTRVSSFLRWIQERM